MAGPRAARAEFADDLFARRRRGSGAPVVNQFVWRFDRPIEAAVLDTLVDRLSEGLLGRRMQRALVPAARSRWIPSRTRPAILRPERPLDPPEIAAWLASCAAADLDPRTRAGWNVAHATITDGSHVVALAVDHSVADGSGMVDAVIRAVTDAEPVVVPDPDIPRILDDAADALGRLTEVTRWAGGLLRRTTPRSASQPTTPSEAGTPAADGVDRAAPAEVVAPALPTDWSAPTVVVELPTDVVEKLAANASGSLNSWFVAFTADLGRDPHDEVSDVSVALPVSGRREADPRGNATRIARVRLPLASLARRDLDDVRTRCRDAYRALDSAVEPVALVFVQMIPEVLRQHLPPPPPASALASNLGRVPEAFGGLGGEMATAVIPLVHQPGLEPRDAAALGGGVISFIAQTPAVTAVSVCALDPARLPDRAALETLLHARLSHWGAEAGDYRLW